MEQRFADLLCGAFSETSLPSSFPDGEFDSSTLHGDEESEVTKRNSYPENFDDDDEDDEDDDVKEDHVSETDNKDSRSTKVSVINMDQTTREQHESWEGDPEEDEEEGEEEDREAEKKPEDWSVMARCGREFWDSDKEDRVFAEGLPLEPEETENTQVRNEERGQSESDEDVSYFREIPKRVCEEILRGNGIDEDEQERRGEWIEVSTRSEREGAKLVKDDGKGMDFLKHSLPQEDGGQHSDATVCVTLDFPQHLLQNLQDRISDDDVVGKMKDFSGDDHQEAGESFAQFPSDFSSCEYMEDGRMNVESKYKLTVLPKENTDLEQAGAEDTSTAGDVNTVEREDPFPDTESKGTDVDTQIMALHIGGGGKHSRGKMALVKHELGRAAVRGWVVGEEVDETTYLDAKHKTCSEADSSTRRQSDRDIHCDSDDNSGCGRTDNTYHQDPDDKLLECVQTHSESRAEAVAATTGEKVPEEIHPLAEPREDIHTTIHSSKQGSVDDGFFFDEDCEEARNTELEQLGDDEYEEERDWEQEQERIKAFYSFYNEDERENGEEGRKIKVQFCTEPLSRIIPYEMDCSDRESLDSSTDGEEEQCFADTYDELEYETLKMNSSQPGLIPENLTAPSNTQLHTRKHKCLGVLKLILKMGLVLLMGLLMFWWTTDQMDWIVQAAFSKR